MTDYFKSAYTINESSKKIFRYLLPALLAVAAIFLAIHFSGGCTTGPLFAGGDVAQWEFLGHYFYKNLSLFPLPHINLHTDQIFYPYGVNAVLEPWSIEREYFFTLFFSLFGTGPWFFIYYIFSMLISCLGLFALFKKDFGVLKASLAGLVAVFFNFYALAKFPDHFSISVLHWTILGIAADYLLIRRITARENIPLRLLLLRCLLTVLAIGLGLGYAAGSSLFSLTFCGFYALLFLLGYRLKKREAPYRLKELMKNWGKEVTNHKRHCIALFLGTALFIFLYVPIVLQIYLATKEFAGIPQGAMWSSPWRILIPWLPWINPGIKEPAWLKGLINDFPEGLGAGSPGFFLLFAALAGILFSRRKAALVPFIIMLLWILANQPYKGLSLTVFPWFKYARVGSRFTMLMAPLLTILALEVPLSKFKKSYLIAGFFMLLAVIGGLEFYTFANCYHYRASNVPEGFYNYMKTVKNTPGEAVLDWPFCIAGGNGVGTDFLGRFYHLNNAVGFMQRYHGKKIVGNYFGRLSMKQIEPFLRAGWHKMFHPDNPSPFQSKRQAVPMTEPEWDFFDKFYTLNDFCGISLYPGLLAPGDKQKFYERFGKPEISSKVAGGLEAVFIAKDQRRRGMVEKLEGKKITYWPFVEPGSTIDLVKPEIPSEITATGIFNLAKSKIGLVRLAGNATELFFKSENKETAELAITCYIKSVTTLVVNNQPYTIARDLKGHVRFGVKKGINRIIIITDDKKGPTIAFKELKIKVQ